jgi:hypothetical protein
MFLWLPERIYNNIKDNKEYLSIIKPIEDKLAEIDDLVLFNNVYVDGSILNPADFWLKSNLSGLDKKLYSIIMTDFSSFSKDDIIKFLNDEQDIENKLFILYEAESSLVGNPDDFYFELVGNFIEIVDKNSETIFSERIYVKYLQYKSLLIRRNILTSSEFVGVSEFDSFFNYIMEIKNKICNLFSNSDYIRNIICHKVIFEVMLFSFYVMFNHVLTLKNNELNYIHNKCLSLCYNTDDNPIKFKYSGSSPYEIGMMYVIFQHFIVRSDLLESVSIHNMIVDRCNEMLKNKKLLIKASLHHNLDDLLSVLLSMFVVNKINLLLPTFYTSKIDETLLTENEKKVIINGDFSNIVKENLSMCHFNSVESRIRQIRNKFEI